MYQGDRIVENVGESQKCGAQHVRLYEVPVEGGECEYCGAVENEGELCMECGAGIQMEYLCGKCRNGD
jgi:hypothetical protein